MAGLVSDKEDNKALRKPEKVCSEIMTRQRQLSETDAELCQGHHGAAGDAISSSKTAFLFLFFATSLSLHCIRCIMDMPSSSYHCNPLTSQEDS